MTYVYPEQYPLVVYPEQYPITYDYYYPYPSIGKDLTPLYPNPDPTIINININIIINLLNKYRKG